MAKLFDRPILDDRAATEHSVMLDMIQTTLDNSLQWYAGLARSLSRYKAQPELEVLGTLGAKEPSDGQAAANQAWREALCAAKRARRQGKQPGEQMDSGNRKWEHMPPLEQECLYRYDSGEIEQQMGKHLVKARPSFRCTM